ncbi:MAG: hypothetical protein ACTSRA_19775, partial [Promethearchaeota archaeon]
MEENNSFPCGVGDKKPAWENGFIEALRNHPDPDAFKQRIVKILIDMTFQEEDDAFPRAISEHEVHPRRRILDPIFGSSARVKVLESLLQYPNSWFNLVELAKVSGVGISSAKRVVDSLLNTKPPIIEESETGKHERLVKLRNSP